MEEAQEEILINSCNNSKLDQQSHIVKGKRTKRLRPQSPLIQTNVSPAASSAEDFFDSTEEDEDMANCLIMLAQCQSSRESPPKRVHYDHQQEEIGQIQIHNHNSSKFNSRRFLESPSSGTGTGMGAGGYYVYECKTCNRTFPSFQALGGHRASHKKPKAMVNDERLLKSQQQQQFLVSNSDEEDGNFRNVSSLSLHLTNNNNNRGGNSNLYSSCSNKITKSNKIHECSICGAEFTSGQALGGHMRRHRTAPVATTTAATTTTNTTLSLTPMAVKVEEPRKSRSNMLSLDLDLNLPAPEDDLRESKLPFSSKQQQQQQQQTSLVISAGPTLVDCHY